jgi:hypothetical protein
MEEVWVDIKNHEGLYKISNLGRIKSLQRVVYTPGLNSKNNLATRKEKILKPTVNSSGYYCVRLLDNDGVRKNYKLHRLIASAFIPNLHNLDVVNHKDFNILNNSIDNLEWVSIRENNCHKIKQNKEKVGVYKLSTCNRYVSQIVFNGKNKYLGIFKTEDEAYDARVSFELNNNIVNKYL